MDNESVKLILCIDAIYKQVTGIAGLFWFKLPSGL